MGFNHRKLPDRTVSVAVDLSAAFDTVCLNNLLSIIIRSQLSLATARWLSCYLRGRQAKTCFRCVKSTSLKVNTGVPQGSKLLPSLFSFYIADMLRPFDPVRWICYANDLTIWASGINIPNLYVCVNSYLEEVTAYLKDNSLLISTPKFSVMLLTPDTPSQGTSKNTHRGFTTAAGPMPKDIVALHRHILIIHQAQQREDQAETTSSRPWNVHHGDNRREHL